MSTGAEFVVTWQFEELQARRFGASGAPLSGEFQVNVLTNFNSGGPAIAMDPGGGFVVAWTGHHFVGSTIHLRRFDRAGLPRTGDVQVQTFTIDNELSSDVAIDGRGELVVVWERRSHDQPEADVFGQRFDRAGAPRGQEFRVNTHTTGLQGHPSVGAARDGPFVVVWQSQDVTQDGSEYGIFGQLFDAAGSPRGAEFRVNTFTTARQVRPAVASDASGNFVVVWQSDTQDGWGFGVIGQRYDAFGKARGSEFAVSTYTIHMQTQPAVASDAEGTFVVAWIDGRRDGSYEGIFARRFDASGAPRGPDFAVNAQTIGYQLEPAVASDGSGNFVVAWESFPLLREPRSPTGESQGIFARRFGGLTAAALVVNTEGNGVLEPGERVDVRPSWRNLTGTTQAVDGALGRFTGPAAAAYTLVDGGGSYGTLDVGSLASCSDCYLLEISPPTARPVAHWDASVEEALFPEAQGQRKQWLLHVGGSFTDVAPTSPFYPFVETLLHRGVTAGCTTAQYCPSSATTRAQMAVFALVAKEGPWYAPPACVPPNTFDDVSETSPFCSWIQELGRRGATAGCAPGLFCPAEAVTREQMAAVMLRTLDPTLTPPDCVAPNLFADVPETSPFCRWVEELANRGVVAGCGGGNYCPKEPVTRAQMAVLVGATFGLTLYGP